MSALLLLSFHLPAWIICQSNCVSLSCLITMVWFFCLLLTQRNATIPQLYTISAFDADGGDGNGTKAWAIFCGLISSFVSGILAFLQVQNNMRTEP